MAVYEALLLNTVVPQIQAAQAGDSYVMVVNATTPALRITQTGTGNALEVEDSANPDATPFVVSAAGDVGIGTNAPESKLAVKGTSAQSDLFSISDITVPTSGSEYGVAMIKSASADYLLNLTSYGGTGKGARIYHTGGVAADYGLLVTSAGGDRLIVDGVGNLGLGVTPSAWFSSFKGFDLSTAGAISGSGNGTILWGNCFINASASERYKTNGFAVKYVAAADIGAHIWQTAASGTAGDAISFTQAMTLDASGNLGVGTTSPNSYVTNGLAVVSSVNSTQTRFAVVNPSSGGSAGAVQTLISDSDQRLDVMLTSTGWGNYGTIKTRSGTISAYGNAGTFLTLAGQAGVIFGYGANPHSEAARITSGGYFKASNTGTYLGSTGSYHELRTNTDNAGSVYITSAATNGTQYGAVIRTVDDQNDATRYFLTCEGSTTERATIRSNGGLANYSANNVNLASDERLKKDISPLSSTWDKLKTIEVVNFRYKDCNEGDPLLYGVIAQQVQPIVPELVVVTQEAKEAVEAKDAVLDADGNVVEPAIAAKEATPEYYGIREQPMYWLAIKALQEAMARIETLEAEVAALKGA